MSNSDNPRNGAAFQKEVLAWFEKHYGTEFELEKKIPVSFFDHISPLCSAKAALSGAISARKSKSAFYQGIV